MSLHSTTVLYTMSHSCLTFVSPYKDNSSEWVNVSIVHTWRLSILAASRQRSKHVLPCVLHEGKLKHIETLPNNVWLSVKCVIMIGARERKRERERMYATLYYSVLHDQLWSLVWQPSALVVSSSSRRSAAPSLCWSHTSHGWTLTGPGLLPTQSMIQIR